MFLLIKCFCKVTHEQCFLQRFTVLSAPRSLCSYIHVKGEEWKRSKHFWKFFVNKVDICLTWTIQIFKRNRSHTHNTAVYCCTNYRCLCDCTWKALMLDFSPAASKKKVLFFLLLSFLTVSSGFVCVAIRSPVVFLWTFLSLVSTL